MFFCRGGMKFGLMFGGMVGPAILEASVATTATYNMSQFGLTAAEEATERAKWKNAAEFYASTKVMDMSCEYAKCVSVLLLGLYLVMLMISTLMLRWFMRMLMFVFVLVLVLVLVLILLFCWCHCNVPHE